jgi:Fe-S cluster biogenesis protein NfuA
MSADAQQVVEQFNEIVKPEGGAVEMLSVDGGVLRVRYVPGTNEECASCVLTADELRDMMKESVQTFDPSIEAVEVEPG